MARRISGRKRSAGGRGAAPVQSGNGLPSPEEIVRYVSDNPDRASKRDIVVQFLVEATLISILGGLIGIVAGIGISWLIAFYTGWTTAVPLSAVLLAFFVSISVGIIFGSFPAAKASGLDPVKALRYE